MYVFKIKNILVAFLIIVILIIGILICGSKDNLEATSSKVYSNIIVVDAGHGLPDGGAEGNGIIESDINLAIAQKLEKKLIDLGYDVIMTREDENNIADDDKQTPISEMKKSDLNNRVKIINESNADFGISIHLNKYSSSKYWGWQTFYSEKSEQGKMLADLIQNNILKTVNRNNTRQALKISNIRIVDKTKIPVVIVECGFISNEEEANLLKEEDYQLKLVERNL